MFEDVNGRAIEPNLAVATKGGATARADQVSADGCQRRISAFVGEDQGLVPVLDGDNPGETGPRERDETPEVELDICGINMQEIRDVRHG